MLGSFSPKIVNKMPPVINVDEMLFDILKEEPSDETISAKHLFAALNDCGISRDDARLLPMIQRIGKTPPKVSIIIEPDPESRGDSSPENSRNDSVNLDGENLVYEIDPEEIDEDFEQDGDVYKWLPDHVVENTTWDKHTFKWVISPCCNLIHKALQRKLIIPDWRTFSSKIDSLCSAAVAYVDNNFPELTGQDFRLTVSTCTVDGQKCTFTHGPAPENDINWCQMPKVSYQSLCYVFTYAIVHNSLGADVVHGFVGTEPSGRPYNDICLDRNNKPHNPLVNAGGLVCASLIKPGASLEERFSFNHCILIEKSIARSYASEKEHGYRNFALAYYLMEHKCFPPETEIPEILEMYFRANSLCTDADALAVMAATLANGGMCPVNNVNCLSNRSCRDTLSLMYSCGMYDYSGLFAFKVGLPAKATLAGTVLLVIPNIGGMCIHPAKHLPAPSKTPSFVHQGLVVINWN